MNWIGKLLPHSQAPLPAQIITKLGISGNEALIYSEIQHLKCYLQGLVGRLQVYTGTLEDYLGQSNLSSINKVYIHCLC